MLPRCQQLSRKLTSTLSEATTWSPAAISCTRILARCFWTAWTDPTSALQRQRCSAADHASASVSVTAAK